MLLELFLRSCLILGGLIRREKGRVDGNKTAVSMLIHYTAPVNIFPLLNFSWVIMETLASDALLQLTKGKTSIFILLSIELSNDRLIRLLCFV